MSLGDNSSAGPVGLSLCRGAGKGRGGWAQRQQALPCAEGRGPFTAASVCTPSTPCPVVSWGDLTGREESAGCGHIKSSPHRQLSLPPSHLTAGTNWHKRLKRQRAPLGRWRGQPAIHLLSPPTNLHQVILLTKHSRVRDKSHRQRRRVLCFCH